MHFCLHFAALNDCTLLHIIPTINCTKHSKNNYLHFNVVECLLFAIMTCALHWPPFIMFRELGLCVTLSYWNFICTFYQFSQTWHQNYTYCMIEVLFITYALSMWQSFTFCSLDSLNVTFIWFVSTVICTLSLGAWWMMVDTRCIIQVTWHNKYRIQVTWHKMYDTNRVHDTSHLTQFARYKSLDTLCMI